MCLGELAVVVDLPAPATAVVDGGGRCRSVSLLTLEDVPAPGDWLLIHAGFALARLSADEAQAALILRATKPSPGTRS